MGDPCGNWCTHRLFIDGKEPDGQTLSPLERRDAATIAFFVVDPRKSKLERLPPPSRIMSGYDLVSRGTGHNRTSRKIALATYHAATKIDNIDCTPNF